MKKFISMCFIFISSTIVATTTALKLYLDRQTQFEIYSGLKKKTSDPIFSLKIDSDFLSKKPEFCKLSIPNYTIYGQLVSKNFASLPFSAKLNKNDFFQKKDAALSEPISELKKLDYYLNLKPYIQDSADLLAFVDSQKHTLNLNLDLFSVQVSRPSNILEIQNCRLSNANQNICKYETSLLYKCDKNDFIILYFDNEDDYVALSGLRILFNYRP